MASRPPANGLPYGSYGRAFYDSHEQNWRFQRDDHITYNLRPFGEAEILHLCSSTVHKDVVTGPEHDTNLAPRIQSALLAKTHQDTNSTGLPLVSLLRESEAVAKAQDQHDPAQGTLLANGMIRCESTRRAIPVFAHATGACGSDLRIVCVATIKRGWRDSKQAWLDLQIPVADDITWTGDGCPIQQVCFTPATEIRASTLALRFHSKTTIFQPVLRQAVSSELDGSRLDPNPVCELSAEFTGGKSHVDVAFNPWQPSRFAIVDQTGTCTIWHLEGRMRDKPKLSCTIHPRSEKADAGHRDVVGDGWGRVHWINNANTVMVCTRQDATVFDIEFGTVNKLCTAWAAASLEAGWLQDIAMIPSQPNHVAILDASHLSLLQLQQHVKGELTVQRVLSIRHYLSDVHMSSRLFLSSDKDGYFLSLHSQSRSSLFVYRCSFDQGVGMTIMSFPSELNVSAGWSDHLIAKGTLDMILRPAVTLSSSNMDVTGTTASFYKDQSVRFVAVFVLTSKRCLHLQLVAVTPSTFARYPILPLQWEKRTHNTSAARAPQELFVIPDGTEEEDESKGATRQEPLSTFTQKKAAHQTSRKGPDWNVDYTRSVQNLQQSTTVDVEGLLHRVGDSLEPGNVSNVSTSPAFRTLRSLAAEEIVVRDIDEVASLLQDLHHTNQQGAAPMVEDSENQDERTQLTIQSIDQPWGFRPFLAKAMSSLTSVYEQAVAHMISPLSSDVAGRVRLAKEQLARRVAADVTLSSYIIRPSLVGYDPLIESAQLQSPKQRWEIPVRSGRSGRASLERDTEPQANAALPTPSATPSIATATSSHPSSFTAPELNRLMQYTTFSEPLPSTLPRSLRRVLSHWVPGEDVNTYDWISTSRHLTRQTEAEDADSQLTAKERARLQRRAERHIRRQRREAAASQAQQHASSQLPTLAIATSQPVVQPESQQPQSQAQPTGPMANMLGSSQTVDTGVRVASQLVPGRSAGRAPPRKKRKQGF